MLLQEALVVVARQPRDDGLHAIVARVLRCHVAELSGGDAHLLGLHGHVAEEEREDALSDGPEPQDHQALIGRQLHVLGVLGRLVVQHGLRRRRQLVRRKRGERRQRRIGRGKRATEDGLQHRRGRRMRRRAARDVTGGRTE